MTGAPAQAVDALVCEADTHLSLDDDLGIGAPAHPQGGRRAVQADLHAVAGHALDLGPDLVDLTDRAGQGRGAQGGRRDRRRHPARAVDELRSVDPNNPLLNKEAQLQMLGEQMVAKAAEMGFVYDIKSDRVVGKIK